MRENATTHNYTPQKLPHTNSPMAYYHQYPNCNLNHTKSACSITYQAGKSVGNTLPICRIDVGTRKTLSMRRGNKDEPERPALVGLFELNNELVYSLIY